MTVNIQIHNFIQVFITWMPVMLIFRHRTGKPGTSNRYGISPHFLCFHGDFNRYQVCPIGRSYEHNIPRFNPVIFQYGFAVPEDTLQTEYGLYRTMGKRYARIINPIEGD